MWKEIWGFVKADIRLYFLPITNPKAWCREVKAEWLNLKKEAVMHRSTYWVLPLVMLTMLLAAYIGVSLR